VEAVAAKRDAEDGPRPPPTPPSPPRPPPPHGVLPKLEAPEGGPWEDPQRPEDAEGRRGSSGGGVAAAERVDVVEGWMVRGSDASPQLSPAPPGPGAGGGGGGVLAGIAWLFGYAPPARPPAPVLQV